MKKYLPALLVVGVIAFTIILVIFAVVKNRNAAGGDLEEDENVPELALSDRPYTSLTPTEDGHYLALSVENIHVPGAVSMEYELLYQTAEGITQGVPGTEKISGKSSLEKDLLLGSESSGKFRYDEGVETGSLTLLFRNDSGKAVGKLTTDFHLQSGTTTLSSADGSFTYELDEEAEDVFFITMNTFGLKSDYSGDFTSGPYGIFSSIEGDYPGEITSSGNVVMFDGSWNELSASTSNNIGIFIIK